MKKTAQEEAEDGGRVGVKATREDWLQLGLDVLVSDGVDEVKVLTLSQRLGVSRSSFYWYFKSRRDLLDALLGVWRDTNTKNFVAMCEEPAETITGAVCNLFKCFVDDKLFDHRLDFAIRDWSKRSGEVRRVVDRSDSDRLDAIAAMFRRHDYDADEGATRARILYYMQIGYYALELGEPVEERLTRVPGYLRCFTGREPRAEEIQAFRRAAQAAQGS